MRILVTSLAVVALLALALPANAVTWTAKTGDPGLWPYADGPTQETVILPHNCYRLASMVATIDGVQKLVSVGGRTIRTYSRDDPGSDPKYWDNRQSHFSIYTPTSDSWVSADGTDDTDNGDGTWTSVGLCGYNNGNGNLSPTVGQGTGYVQDQGFAYDSDSDGTDEIYVFGGYPQLGGNMAKYDPDTNSWSKVPRGDNDGLYMDGGGLIGSHWYKVHKANYLMDYDVSTDTWQTDINIPGLPDPQFGACSGVIGNKLYIVDTYGAATPGAVYEIDPIAGTFVQKAPTPIPVREAGSVVYDGKLYVLGGRAGGGENWRAIDKIQVYDPVTDSWGVADLDDPSDVLPDRRSGMVAEVIGTTLYIGNGFNGLWGSNAAVLDDLWACDITEISTVPEPATLALLSLGGLALIRRRK